MKAVMKSADKSVEPKAMPDEIIEIHAVFQGDVQGVGFRATARHHAVRLGLVGTVCNRADGSVELYALGKRENVEALLSFLRGPQGPGKVSGVIQNEISPLHYYPDFKIKGT